MPPADSGRQLTAAEIELLKQWIAQDAPYRGHWAFTPPRRRRYRRTCPTPAGSGTRWMPSCWRVWIGKGCGRRRPPTRPRSCRRADAGPDRPAADHRGGGPVRRGHSVRTPTRKLVDRLLASPAYGERWARVWLDLARYADSAGYAQDPARTIWRYRDWVIRALNDNLPFDQFTIEQLAGDLLPNPTEDQLLATAFHRNTMTNSEGGTDDEEFRNVAVVDRVNTTMEVWMGLTMGCAQCHNHKYDPITQEEFFRFFAILNNTEDADRGDESPNLVTFTAGGGATEEARCRRRSPTWRRSIAEKMAAAEVKLPQRDRAAGDAFRPHRTARQGQLPAPGRGPGLRRRSERGASPAPRPRSAPITRARLSWRSTATPTATTSRPSRPRTPPRPTTRGGKSTWANPRTWTAIVVWNRTDGGAGPAA